MGFSEQEADQELASLVYLLKDVPRGGLSERHIE